MSWLADIALGALMLELVAIALVRRQYLKTAVIGALPGLFLLLALRAALMDAAWTTIAALLAASLPVHLFDLRMRLKE